MNRPLAGRRVLVTRQPDQGGELADGLVAAGARVLWCPLLRIAPPRDSGPLRRAMARLPAYDWLVFTSRNAVERSLAVMPAGGPATGWPAIAAVGAGTALAVEQAGLAVDLLPDPDRQDAPGLVAALVERGITGLRVLLPQADNARPTLRDGLAAAGARVDAVVAYRGCGIAYDAPPVDIASCDALTFASSATVQRFAAIPGLPDRWPRPVAIGRQTAATLAELGQPAAAVATEPTMSALVQAVVDACR